jgi:hypothetical protein
VRFGDFLVRSQAADGSIATAWDWSCRPLANDKRQTPHAVPFLASLFAATKDARYRDAAVAAGDFSAALFADQFCYNGGAVDNPDVPDKEAGWLSTQAFIAPGVVRDARLHPAHRAHQSRARAAHPGNQYAQVSEIGREIAGDRPAPVADGRAETADPEAGAFDRVHRPGEFIVGHRRRANLPPLEEAQFDRRPAQGPLRGDLPGDIVGRFVGEAGEREGGHGGRLVGRVGAG